MNTAVSQHFSGERRISKMNVSPEADAGFMSELAQEDPKRHAALARNIRADRPLGSQRMSEDQALTNFMLGLPTGQYRFAVIAGAPAPEPRAAEPHLSAYRKRVKLAKMGRAARAKQLSDRTEISVAEAA